MTEPKKPKPDADLNRIDQALADIERHRQEIQTASLVPVLAICLLRRNNAGA